MPPFNKPFNKQPAAPAAKTGLSSAAHLVIRITALIEEIVGLMNDEIPLVEGRKREQHAELLKRKQRLTLDYRASIKAIIMDPNLLRQVPDDIRQKARRAADRLAEASERNARTLRAVMTASQRLVQSIIAIIKEEALPKPGYKNFGAGRKTDRYSPTCKPVTIYKSA